MAAEAWERAHHLVENGAVEDEVARWRRRLCRLRSRRRRRLGQVRRMERPERRHCGRVGRCHLLRRECARRAPEFTLGHHGPHPPFRGLALIR